MISFKQILKIDYLASDLVVNWKLILAAILTKSGTNISKGLNSFLRIKKVKVIKTWVN